MKEIEIKLVFTLPELMNKGDKTELKFKHANVVSYGLQNDAESTMVNNEFIQLMASVKKRHEVRDVKMV